MSTYQVLLFYQFVHVESPIALADELERFCRQRGLRGRIIVAEEGINGTVSGRTADTAAFMDALRADKRFATMPFKVDAADGHVFPRLRVRVRPEIVTFRSDLPVNPARRTGEHLSPAAFHAALEEALVSDDVVVLDGRNDYEYDVGHFRGAIRPDVRTFRDFPAWIREHLDGYQNKRILTYCTGGIRCEKLTGYLLEAGFHDVAQLDGGVVTYAQDPQVRGRLFDGKLYVFDERIVIPVNQEEDTIVGRCFHCGAPTEQFINCRRDACHFQHLVCTDCRARMGGYCSEDCRSLDRVG
ncbi:MAG: rhodanese-related sulfurtransferase [Alicyclobacillus sp.]|nr:rhodanese-related sulfurtransferase [Alicyclobacillus sp.]